MGRREGVKISSEIRAAFLADQSPARRGGSSAAQGDNASADRMAISPGGGGGPRASPCPSCCPHPALLGGAMCQNPRVFRGAAGLCPLPRCPRCCRSRGVQTPEQGGRAPGWGGGARLQSYPPEREPPDGGRGNPGSRGGFWGAEHGGASGTLEPLARAGTRGSPVPRAGLYSPAPKDTGHGGELRVTRLGTCADVTAGVARGARGSLLTPSGTAAGCPFPGEGAWLRSGSAVATLAAGGLSHGGSGGPAHAQPFPVGPRRCCHGEAALGPSAPHRRHPAVWSLPRGISAIGVSGPAVRGGRGWERQAAG